MSELTGKICVLGEFAVGKTSTIARFVHNQFSEKYLTTVGVKIDTKSVAVGSHTLKMVIWDIAGGHTLADGLKNYLKGCMGIVAVADGTRAETLTFIESLLQEVAAEYGEIPYVLLLNKTDLKSEWELDPSRTEQLKQNHPHVFLTSAKEDSQVEDALACLAQVLMARELADL